jgi:hypothetical protein
MKAGTVAVVGILVDSMDSSISHPDGSLCSPQQPWFFFVLQLWY